jgi:3-oxoacyl-[acyl-carrier protein] reductase
MGAGIALQMAHDGAAVAVLDIDPDGAEATAEAVRVLGGTAVAVTADVSDDASTEAAVARATDALGGFGADARLHELELSVWQRTVAVNLGGVFLTLKHGLPRLMSEGGGSVVIIGSPTGFVATAPGFTAYSSSKGGLLAMTRVVAVDYAGDGIRCNLVVPGFTDTPLVRDILDSPPELQAMLATIPLGRPGRPAEIGSMVSFLASEEAAYATGGVFPVDGGMTAI